MTRRNLRVTIDEQIDTKRRKPALRLRVVETGVQNHASLRDDRSGVNVFGDLVHGNATVTFAVIELPKQRARATVARQQRWMNIEAAVCRQSGV